MSRHGVAIPAIVLALLLGGSMTSHAFAQPATPLPSFAHRVEAGYWFAGSTGFVRLGYSGSSLSSPFGLRANAFLGGTSTFWGVDLTFRPARLRLAATPRGETFLARATLGYGSFRFDAALGPATSSGFGFGTDSAIILSRTANGGWLGFVADATWYPSNSTTGPGGPGTAAASVWSVGIRYKAPSRHSGVPSTDTIPVSTLQAEVLGTEWDFTAGFRDIAINIPGGSVYRWSGLFLAFGKTF